MTAVKNIFGKPVTLIIAAGVLLFFLVKNHFFYDEDVFVVNVESSFMQQSWQRSFLVKQIFRVEQLFFGINPLGFHIVSISLHLANSFAAFLLLKKMLHYFNAAVSSNTASTTFLIFFLFSPIHSEPLSYLLAQGIVIFSVVAVCCLLFFLKASNKITFFYYLSVLFFVLALLCYEVSWVLPLIILTIVIFNKAEGGLSVRDVVKLTLPFFVVLAAWLTVKYFFIAKSLVADYQNVTLTNIDVFKCFRNSIVLFIRNFVTPFSTTSTFIFIALCMAVLLGWFLFKVYLINRKVFAFLLLLLLLVILATAPASLFGIDSHDSESERYVYFSSVFAIMFLAIVLDVTINKAAMRQLTAAFISTAFILLLCNAINHYKLGGSLSKKYISLLAPQINNTQKVYLINQPSQYKGAVMFRALTRLPHLKEQHHTVINEYMQYLYNNTHTEFITVSKKEITQIPFSIKLIVKPADTAMYYFNEAAPIFNGELFVKNQTVIAAFRADTLFIFR